MKLRREIVWSFAVVLAFAVGMTCDRAYAQLMAPFYTTVDQWMTFGRPWSIGTVQVAKSDSGPGLILKTTSEVRRNPADRDPAIRAVTRVQIAEAIETPLVFWTVVLMWPAVSVRQRLLRAAMAVPAFLGLEAITTGLQLMHVLPAASAMLAGQQNPHTMLDRWSEFLESGGRYAVEVLVAMIVVASTVRSRGL